MTEHEDLFGIAADPTTDTVQAAAARSVLTLLVQSEITDQFLAANGESITDADRQAVIDSFGEEDPLADLPDDVASALVDSQAGASAAARIPAPSAEELQAQYEESREDLGIVCVRHVQVATEEEAQAVLDELEAGASIEDLARERSTDESAATNGGRPAGRPGRRLRADLGRRGALRSRVRRGRGRRRSPGRPRGQSSRASAGTSSRPRPRRTSPRTSSPSTSRSGRSCGWRRSRLGSTWTSTRGMGAGTR